MSQYSLIVWQLPPHRLAPDARHSADWRHHGCHFYVSKLTSYTTYTTQLYPYTTYTTFSTYTT